MKGGSFMASSRQCDPSNTNQNKNVKHQKHRLWAEGKTWNEMDGESLSACRGKKKRGVGRGQVMEHSGTALPTCYRIFYYYGDFSVAPSFAQTVKKREKREIEQKGRESYLKPRRGTVSQENRDVNLETFKTVSQEKEGLSYRATNKHTDYAGTLPFKCHLHFLQTRNCCELVFHHLQNAEASMLQKSADFNWLLQTILCFNLWTCNTKKTVIALRNT